MFQLYYQNRVFTHLDEFKHLDDGAPAFVKAAFAFCEDWLSGQEFFNQETSGSTGVPKQITIHRKQLEASAHATGEFFQANSNWKILCCLSPEYIAGKMMLVRAMVWGCVIELIEPSSNPFASIDPSNEYGLVAMVPMQVEATLANPGTLAQLKDVKNLLIGGAATKASIQKKLIDSGISAFQSFGMTETVSHFALAKITGELLTYQTLPGVEIGITEDQLLWVKSEMSGPEPIQTTDRVELLSDNTFRWLGRSDFVINSGGVKIHPEVLEQKAARCIHQEFPDASFFFGSELDEKLGQRLLLFIETESIDESKARDLKESLKLILDQYEVPKKIILLTAFHRTLNGKLDRTKTSQDI